MEALVLGLKTAGALITGGEVAAGGLGALSATVGLVGGLGQTIYSMNVAKQTAATMKENADRAEFTAQVAQQDADINAAAIIAEQQAGRAHSGFATTSGTYERMDRRNRVMARRDATRIRQDGTMEAAQYRAKGAEATAEARGLGLAGFFDTLGSVLDLKSSLVSDAALTTKKNTIEASRIRVNSQTRPRPNPLFI